MEDEATEPLPPDVPPHPDLSALAPLAIVPAEAIRRFRALMTEQRLRGEPHRVAEQIVRARNPRLAAAFDAAVGPRVVAVADRPAEATATPPAGIVVHVGPIERLEDK